ncbi:Hypothetical predicted protein [Pelobates cultripes]|uniref:Uncharacterized protein n=1 Tax=Pelobates cultripes TaxID=61616 RepID=A0AAD1W0B6_PELCU|nr:Hypothetical predicted protein [Pelobates cultripes]
MAPAVPSSEGSSEGVQDNGERLTSPEISEQDSDSEDDSSPATKGDIKPLLIDLRKIWKSDLKETQMEMRVLHQQIKEVETREKS